MNRHGFGWYTPPTWQVISTVFPAAFPHAGEAATAFRRTVSPLSRSRPDPSPSTPTLSILTASPALPRLRAAGVRLAFYGVWFHGAVGRVEAMALHAVRAGRPWIQEERRC